MYERRPKFNEEVLNDLKVDSNVGISGNTVISGDASVGNNITVGGTASIAGAATADSLTTSTSIKTDGWLSHKNTLLNNSASVAVGTGGSYGAASTILAPDSNHVGVVPLAGSVTVGGTVGTSETITVEIIAHYSDGTTGSITKSFTATGTDYLTAADLLTLLKNGVYIESVTAQAESSATSTSATVTVAAAGLQH